MRGRGRRRKRVRHVRGWGGERVRREVCERQRLDLHVEEAGEHRLEAGFGEVKGCVVELDVGFLEEVGEWGRVDRTRLGGCGGFGGGSGAGGADGLGFGWFEEELEIGVGDIGGRKRSSSLSSTSRRGRGGRGGGSRGRRTRNGYSWFSEEEESVAWVESLGLEIK